MQLRLPKLLKQKLRQAHTHTTAGKGALLLEAELPAASPAWLPPVPSQSAWPPLLTHQDSRSPGNYGCSPLLRILPISVIPVFLQVPVHGISLSKLPQPLSALGLELGPGPLGPLSANAWVGARAETRHPEPRSGDCCRLPRRPLSRAESGVGL